MELQSEKGYELAEKKSLSGDIEELQFKIHSVIGVNKNTKKKILGLIAFFGIIFCLFKLFFLPFFVIVFVLVLNEQTITVNKKSLEIKNSIPVFPKTKMNIENIDHFEVKRIETRNKDGKTMVTFQLVAFFKDNTNKKIYYNSNMALVDKMDKTIEDFLNITDETNDKQLDQLSTSNLERDLKDEHIVEETLGNIDTSVPSKDYPFSLKSDLISVKVTYFSRFNQKSIGLFLIIFGLVFSIGSFGLFSPIGIPLFIWGLKKTLNKQYVLAYSNKLTYVTKPISLKKEKELLKSEIKSIEVIPSNVRTNGVMSFHLVANTNESKKIKLMTHVFNVIALRDIANKINNRLGFDNL